AQALRSGSRVGETRYVLSTSPMRESSTRAARKCGNPRSSVNSSIMLPQRRSARDAAAYSSDRCWYELPPGVRFRHHLDLAIARFEKAAQVSGQNEPLGHPTEHPEGRCEGEDVAHDSPASTILREVVLVIESRE